MTTVHTGDVTTDCVECIRRDAQEFAYLGFAGVTNDADFLCSECILANLTLISEANGIYRDYPDSDQWRLVGSQYADTGDTCAHCYKEIVEG